MRSALLVYLLGALLHLTAANAQDICNEYKKFARADGLHYISPSDQRGISRIRQGKKFKYIDSKGHVIHKEATLARIRALQIPPIYHEVWISEDTRAHIQATALDPRGRVQYRYHPLWLKAKGARKFERAKDFNRLLPKMRQKIQRDLAEDGLGKRKVLALMTSLLDKTFIRIGSEEYVKENASYGLSTFKKSHLEFVGDKIKFSFLGKSHVRHAISVKDSQLAAILKKLKKLRGRQLFQYQDEEGATHTISADDVNDYLGEISGGDFTAKDFRTAGATRLAEEFLAKAPKPKNEADKKANIDAAVAYVAEKLGNTPAIAKSSYIDPRVLSSY
jgi:DNA topoisomerase-1